MLEKVEKTAKSLDEAIELAAKELGVEKEDISYEVTREVGKGFMRFLVGSEVDIVAWRTSDAEKDSKKAIKNIDKAPVKHEKINAEAVEKTETKAPERVKAEEKDIIIPKTAIDDAKYFVSELLTKIGLKFELNVKIDGNIIVIDVTGEKMGLLIGKRGDTLDAVQMLTNLYVNRKKSSPYIKVNIDTENYRSKREETLIRLAHGIERSVLRDKKSITLEPMTANERRIIHSALQNNPKIKTYSVGEEPNRRMVISLSKPVAEKTE